MNNKTKKILTEYEADYSTIQAFTKKLELLVREILDDQGIMVHSVNGRTKDKESLTKKIENSPNGHYEKLNDITDLCGVRIITYFSDDVDQAANAISKEFTVDNNFSVDKRNQHDSDAFGYMSVHYIVSLSEGRSNLSEYKKFKKIRAEIQIRSVLQHAWAEIEHDLGYKTEREIPKHLRRKFSRLASLLELGDEEFINIRENLKNYQEKVEEKLTNEPEQVELNKLSLLSFIQSTTITELDKEIAKACNYSISTNTDSQAISNTSIERHLKRLQYFGFETIAEVKSKLTASKTDIIKFSKSWIKGLSKRNTNRNGELVFPQAISLYYLALYTLYLTGDMNFYYEYWENVAGYPDEEAERNVTLMMDVYTSNLPKN